MVDSHRSRPACCYCCQSITQVRVFRALVWKYLSCRGWRIIYIYMFLLFCCWQNDVLDRLGKETQNRVSMDGRTAQRGAVGWRPGLAYWACCGLSEWEPDLLVWLQRKHYWVHEAWWHRQEYCHIRRSVAWALMQSVCRRTNPQRQTFLPLVADIGHPYSLDVFEGHVYWTTKDKGEVWRTNKFGKGNKVKVLTINPWLTQVRIYQEHRHNRSGERELNWNSLEKKNHSK